MTNSLREAIKQNIQHARYNAFAFTGIDTEGARKNIDHETDAILDTVLAHMPSEFGDSEDKTPYQKGYDEAISNVRDILMSAKEEK